LLESQDKASYSSGWLAGWLAGWAGGRAGEENNRCTFFHSSLLIPTSHWLQASLSKQGSQRASQRAQPSKQTMHVQATMLKQGTAKQAKQQRRVR
jgi:hypothetical protein